MREINKKVMKQNDMLSTTELANILNISRIAVYKKIKSGQIPATRVGRNFVINKGELDGILDHKATPNEKQKIKKAIKKAVLDYSVTLKLLDNS